MLSLTFSLQAQNATEGKISLLKADQPCVQADYNVSEDLLEEVISDKLAQYKIKKGDKVKGGFRVYKGVSIAEISDDKIDLYVVTSGKNNNSKASILVSKGYDNFVSSASEPDMVEKMKTFLNSLNTPTLVAQIKYDIKKQEEVVDKTEKTEKSLIKDGQDLEKELKRIQEKIEQNKKDVENAKNNVTGEKATLSELKSKLEHLNK